MPQSPLLATAAANTTRPQAARIRLMCENRDRAEHGKSSSKGDSPDETSRDLSGKCSPIEAK
jgi:hypothetical protein